jgi:hypothetical protein
LDPEDLAALGRAPEDSDVREEEDRSEHGCKAGGAKGLEVLHGVIELNLLHDQASSHVDEGLNSPCYQSSPRFHSTRASRNSSDST